MGIVIFLSIKNGGEVMGREFDRNMFIMLLAVMMGVVIITFFVADILNSSEVETATSKLAEEHIVEIGDINSKNENFTDNFLQGSVKMDSARETREVGNYYFDLSSGIWYAQGEYQKVIDNCTFALSSYLSSADKFAESKPYFENASKYTDKPSYKGVLDYYVNFSEKGQEITMLRYDMTLYLQQIAENLSLGTVECIENASLLLGNYSLLEESYIEMAMEYEELKDLIDDYMFFEEDRTKLVD